VCFGVKKGKFLGCLVSTKGIEANPNKIEAILRMRAAKYEEGGSMVGRKAGIIKYIYIQISRKESTVL
jgi:hypothetical protein